MTQMSQLYGNAVYKDMFCQLYQCPTDPVSAPLSSLLHWKHRINRWGLSDQPVHRMSTFIPKGYFYSIHTPHLTDEDIAHIATSSAAVTLIPNLRKRSAEDGLFIHLPWCLEAFYYLKDDLDTDLRAQLGKKRHKEILRHVRNATSDYEFTVFQGSQVHTPEALDTFATLHQFNALKYGHGLNIYDREILDTLVASPLGQKMIIATQRDRQNGRIVQSSLGLVCKESGEMIQLAQGIDHDQVPSTQNLYVAETYQLYQWGLDHGVTKFNLGRDNPLMKRSLGANHFFPLENRLHIKNRDLMPQVLDIQRIAEASHQAEVDLLLNKNFVKSYDVEENCFVCDS